ncbi:MAG TPA: hypothetical protein VJ142_03315 [Candidatus Nanoarchaeia archaeon]|nr:hypothetical protein [Candidatus Nanoarchaeia archaeon]
MELLWKLSSAYEACTLSACDPISVPSDIKLLAGRYFLSHMFYDCTDPEARGIEMMNQRIREGSEDIRAHFRIHEDLLDNFYSVDDALREGDREGIVKAGRLVFENLEIYGRLVGEHSERLGERAFFHYPTCLPGHIFAPKGAGIIREKVFNPQQDAEGLREEIKNGIALAHFTLPLGPDEALRELSMYTGSDSGDGIFQTSFRGRLELTKVLLERAGFQVAAR